MLGEVEHSDSPRLCGVANFFKNILLQNIERRYNILVSFSDVPNRVETYQPLLFI